MLLALTKSRTTKRFFPHKKGFGIGFGAAAGVAPTTILEIYGEYWDGVNMNPPYIGPALTEVGTQQSLGPGPPLNKKTITTTVMNSEFTLNSLLNADADNYVCFSVSRYPTGASTGLLCDFRETVGGDYNLILETRNGGGDTFNGYLYGNPGSDGTFVDLVVQGEDNDVYKIRVWIFQEGRGDLYLNGGSSVYNDLWEPTPLGDAGYDRRLFRIIAATQRQDVAHFSIHKFSSSETVLLSWVNAYGAALNAYYDSLSWSDIA